MQDPLNTPHPELWSHGFASLGDAFYTTLPPQPLPDPHWVASSASVARLLGLSETFMNSSQALQALAGNAVLAGTQPLASVYSGHQFGVWAGQLGDGRALLLGELTDIHGTPQEIQLKGAGRTPYSRMGDGRAVLRSSVREFLGCEAMHGLGIPTSRALCLVGSQEAVYRERPETAAVLTRVAPSFVRFGHFEHFANQPQASKDAPNPLRQLADWCIARYYPECQVTTDFDANPYAALLHAVGQRTAWLIAQWQAVGFCHGVMNTDNMSLLGLTIDYGPFQFLDAFNPRHVCNHSDTQGRYAFQQQPGVAYWNLFCLGQALLPLIGAQELAIAALEPYKTEFARAMQAAMRAKLGLSQALPEDLALIDDGLKLLAQDGVDYSIFWRRLSHWVAASGDPAAVPDTAVRDLFVDRATLQAWLARYDGRLEHEDRAASGRMMLRTNPKFVLRNHLAQIAIERARDKDFSEVATLLHLLETPFDEHPDFESYAGFAPAWAAGLEISCSS